MQEPPQAKALMVNTNLGTNTKIFPLNIVCYFMFFEIKSVSFWKKPVYHSKLFFLFFRNKNALRSNEKE